MIAISGLGTVFISNLLINNCTIDTHYGLDEGFLFLNTIGKANITINNSKIMNCLGRRYSGFLDFNGEISNHVELWIINSTFTDIYS